MSKTMKKEWQTPEVKSLAAGSAEFKRRTGNDGAPASATNKHVNS